MRSAIVIFILIATQVFSADCARGQEQDSSRTPAAGSIPQGGTVNCNDLAADAAGNVCIGGSYSWQVDLDPGPEVLRREADPSGDAFVSVFDADGNLMWVDTWGDERQDWCQAVAITDEGEVYALGRVTIVETQEVRYDGQVELRTVLKPRVVLRKYNPDGMLTWERQWDVQSPQWIRDFLQLDLDSDGNVYFSGSYADRIDLDPGSDTEVFTGREQVFTCCLSPDGEFMWARTWDGGYDWGDAGILPDLEIQPDGSVSYLYLSNLRETGGLCTGSRSYHLLTEDWETVWCEDLDVRQIYGIDPAVDGSIYVAASFAQGMDLDPGPGTCYSTHDTGCFLLRFDEHGEVDWIRDWTNGRTDNPAPDTLGDFRVSRLGTFLTDSEGNVYTITHTAGQLHMGRANVISRVGSEALPGTRLTKFNPDGEITWMKTWEDENSWPVSLVAVDGSGNVYLATSTSRTLHAAPYGDPEVNLEAAVSPNYQDCFLIKLDSDCNFLWARQWGALPEE